jgi:hypothetical protein
MIQVTHKTQKMKKKFKETTVGKWLTQKAPRLLDKIGDVFPPAKLLSNLVGGDPDISLADQLEFDKLLADTYEKEMAYHLDNTKSARKNYQLSKEMTDWIARRIMNWNLPMLGLLVAANIACVHYFDSVALALVSNVIGMVMQQLINERTTLMNFFLGSSKGSQDKTKELFKNDNFKNL